MRADENNDHQADSVQVGCFGALTGHFGAVVIEFDEFRERLVHCTADRHHLAGVDFLCRRDIALGGKGSHID